MKCACPNCGTVFETSKPKPAKQSAWSKDVRKPWMKNGPDHKWAAPYSTQWTMLAKTANAHKSADRGQSCMSANGNVLAAYANALNVTMAEACSPCAYPSGNAEMTDDVDKAIEVIANCSDDEFEAALEAIQRVRAEAIRAEEKRRFAQYVTEELRSRLLNTIDDFATANKLETMTDADLPAFFRTCDAVADIMLTRTEAASKDKESNNA